MKHKHHIVPKHAGGSDDPSNLVFLTVEEHAEAHKALYEANNNQFDYIAWKGLLGIIGKEEAVLMSMQENGRRNGLLNAGTNNGMFGKAHTDESKAKIVQSLKNRKGEIRAKGKLLSKEHKANISKSNTGKTFCKDIAKRFSEERKGIPKEIVVCPHCNKQGGKPIMARYHFTNCKNKE